MRQIGRLSLSRVKLSLFQAHDLSLTLLLLKHRSFIYTHARIVALVTKLVRFRHARIQPRHNFRSHSRKRATEEMVSKLFTLFNVLRGFRNRRRSLRFARGKARRSGQLSGAEKGAQTDGRT